jgi:hypothetical protein
MVNGKFVSVGEVIWKVMRNPITADLTYEQAAEFAIEFLKLINAPMSYENVVQSFELQDFKTYLPNNLINIRGVRYTGIDGCQDPVAMRYATDLYHTKIDENDVEITREYTYILQNCVLISSRKNGFIDVSFTSLVVDDKGFPMIPDNESYKVGLEYFILHKYLEPLWMMGKIQDKVFQYIEQKRHWYLGQAENSLRLQGIDQLESMMNSINRLIIQDQSHESFYKNFGQKEIIKKYS